MTNGEQGFVDLRVNPHAGQTDEGFWPSFTDIMTVIVMIFLLAMVILLVRNMDLVRQLRATMEAERQAAALARATGAEKDTLRTRLIATESELSMLRLKLMRQKEFRERQEASIASQRHRISRLTEEREQSRQQARERSATIDRLQDELGRTGLELAMAQEDSNRFKERLTRSRDELSRMRLERNREHQRRELSQARLRQARASLSALQDDFSELRVAYDKLIEPARSPKGKQVVEVRYRKQQGHYLIDFKEPGGPGFRRTSRDRLEQRLQALAAQHPEGLYIKLIFPEDSGLTYNEAWNFTRELHGRYDHYYRDRGPASEKSGEAGGADEELNSPPAGRSPPSDAATPAPLP